MLERLVLLRETRTETDLETLILYIVLRRLENVDATLVVIAELLDAVVTVQPVAHDRTLLRCRSAR